MNKKRARVLHVLFFETIIGGLIKTIFDEIESKLHFNLPNLTRRNVPTGTKQAFLRLWKLEASFVIFETKFDEFENKLRFNLPNLTKRCVATGTKQAF